MDTGVFSSVGGTRRYSTTHYIMIHLMVSQLGGGARPAAALYQPFILYQASLVRGGSKDSMSSIFPPVVYVWRR